MCCFVLRYFANTKIDESFRTAKIRRTFFGNSLASKFAGCVRKDDFGSGRLRKNRRRKRKTAQFRRAKGRNDPFIIRKIQSHMQFGFGTSAFFPIFVVQSATAGCLDCTRNLVNFRKQSSAYPALRCGLRRMARDMVSYVITARAICAYCFQGLPEPRVE